MLNEFSFYFLTTAGIVLITVGVCGIGKEYYFLNNQNLFVVGFFSVIVLVTVIVVFYGVWIGLQTVHHG